jgi:hypothetical protein
MVLHGAKKFTSIGTLRITESRLTPYWQPCGVQKYTHAALNYTKNKLLISVKHTKHGKSNNAIQLFSGTTTIGFWRKHIRCQ